MYSALCTKYVYFIEATGLLDGYHSVIGKVTGSIPATANVYIPVEVSLSKTPICFRSLQMANPAHELHISLSPIKCVNVEHTFKTECVYFTIPYMYVCLRGICGEINS